MSVVIGIDDFEPQTWRSAFEFWIAFGGLCAALLWTWFRAIDIWKSEQDRDDWQRAKRAARRDEQHLRLVPPDKNESVVPR